MARVSADVDLDDQWEGENQQIGSNTAHDYSDDENSDSEGGSEASYDSDHDVDTMEKERLDKKRDAEQQALLKSEKKKRKFEELKAKKQQKREELGKKESRAGDDEEGKEVSLVNNNKRLSVEEQHTIFHENQPFGVDGDLLVKLSPQHFYDPYQRDTKKHPCVFVRAIAAGLPGFNKVLRAPSEESGCPLVVVICAGARRAAEVINSISVDLQVKVAKLFAKHFKVQEQIDALNRQHFPIAVGTPNRLYKLAELGALKLSNTQLVLVDMEKDEKEFTVLTLADTKPDFYQFINKFIEPELEHCHIGLVTVPTENKSKQTTQQQQQQHKGNFGGNFNGKGKKNAFANKGNKKYPTYIPQKKSKMG